MKKWLFVVLIFVFVMVGYSGLGAATKPNGSVFEEIKELAVEEGSIIDEGWEAYRRIGNSLFCILTTYTGTSCIIEWDVSGRQAYIVGYYPGGEKGEYLIGIISGSTVLMREFISKEDAERIATEQFNKYKSGKKTTLEEFKHSVSKEIKT